MRSEDDVIEQADALMRRHRSFVARTEDDRREITEPADVEIPVLTEIVDPARLVPQTIEEVVAALRHDIDTALSDWLVEVLPAAVANASQQILAELDAKARHTLLPRLQEILAERAHTPQTAQAESAEGSRDARDTAGPSV
jgi:hypothetical protein